MLSVDHTRPINFSVQENFDFSQEKKKVYDVIEDGLRIDFQRLTYTEATELRTRIDEYIIKKEQAGKFRIPTLPKKEYIQKTIAYYARSKEVYGPIAADWAEHLLAKANESGKKLVFMARDGIVPYKIALQMMQNREYQERFPNLIGQGKIQLAYLSRSVVKHAQGSEENKQLFQEYMNQLGVQNGDECMFVDIGFTGSMIASIKDLLPNVKIDFNFLISHNSDVDGFVYSDNDPRLKDNHFQLPTIKSIPFKGAGGNFATHWLEDSHQGSCESGKYLERGEDGKVYPNTRIPAKKQYAVEPGSLEYLMRKWSQKAVVENWKKFKNDGHCLIKTVKYLDEVLNKILLSQLPLLIKHR